MDECICCGSAGREEIADDPFFPGTGIVRCRGCGLVYPYPRPSGELVEKFYNESYFDFSGPAGAVLRRLKFHFSRLRALDQFEWIMEHGGWEAPGRLLEVGSGYGALSGIFARHGWQAVGVEPSADAARSARKKLAGSPVEIIENVFDRADLPRVEFDLVVMAHVFEHFVAPEQVIERVKLLLRPGGRIYFELPDARSEAYVTDGYTVVPDFYFFDRDNFPVFLEKHGLLCMRLVHLDYRRVAPGFSRLSHAVNFAWWVLLGLLGRHCLRETAGSSAWLRVLAKLPS